jgi:hypothetical protein
MSLISVAALSGRVNLWCPAWLTSTVNMLLGVLASSVAEPELQGARTFAGARAAAIIMIQFSTAALAPCLGLGILRSSKKSILLVSSVDYASTRTWPSAATDRSMKILTHKISYSIPIAQEPEPEWSRSRNFLKGRSRSHKKLFRLCNVASSVDPSSGWEFYGA